MKVKMKYPTEKQKEFLRAENRYIAYGGSRGGGKSIAVQTKAKTMCLEHSGIRILILRRTYRDITLNHIEPLVADTLGVAKYRDKDKTLTFFNGSVIMFGYCDCDADVEQYQGIEYDLIFIDEATQFREIWFTKIRASLRGVNHFPKRMYLTCNPGGVGHDWVKRLFIDKVYESDENPDDYLFIRSTVDDNPYLLNADPEYVKMLDTLPDGLRQAWRYGDWDYISGQYFKEFSRDIHVVSPFVIPSWWRRYRAFDYGLDMLACLWAAVDDSGNVYIYKEFCKPDLIVSDAAQAISDMTLSEEKIEDTIAPPDMWSRQKDTGKTMAELYDDNGIRLYKGDNSRVDGWLNLHEWLKPIVGADGEVTARLKIFDNCRELIRCLPALQADERDPNDVSREPHELTHVVDALRYLIQSRPRISKEMKPKSDFERGLERAISGNRKKTNRF